MVLDAMKKWYDQRVRMTQLISLLQPFTDYGDSRWTQQCEGAQSFVKGWRIHRLASLGVTEQRLPCTSPVDINPALVEAITKPRPRGMEA